MNQTSIATSSNQLNAGSNIKYLPELNAIMITFTLVLYIKYFVATTVLAYYSSKVGSRTKEDFRSKKREENISEELKEKEIRWWYIELNDIEWIPFNLIIFWAARSLVST